MLTNVTKQNLPPVVPKAAPTVPKPWNISCTVPRCLRGTTSDAIAAALPSTAQYTPYRTLSQHRHDRASTGKCLDSTHTEDCRSSDCGPHSFRRSASSKGVKYSSVRRLMETDERNDDRSHNAKDSGHNLMRKLLFSARDVSMYAVRIHWRTISHFRPH